MTLAIHRRPPTAPTPAELLTFSAEEWAAPDDGTDEWRGYRRWQEARRAYAKQHPDSALGPVLDQLRHERRTRHQRMGWTQ